jgi:hypothetical protein
MKRVNMMGRKRSTLAVVSSIITAKAKVILVAPDKTAVAPMIEKKELLMDVTSPALEWNILLCTGP